MTGLQTAEQVGVLVVHGIGEQARLDHLHAVAVELIPALEADASVDRVSVQWDESCKEIDPDLHPDKPPLTISVFKNGGRQPTDGSAPPPDIEIGFHEVWYADLQDPPTFFTRMRFWLWGFSMWRFNEHSVPSNAISSTLTRRPGSGTPPNASSLDRMIYSIDKSNRFRLFLVGVFFVPTIFVMSGIDWVLQRIGIRALGFTNMVASYLDDVKRYQQKAWMRGSRLPDPGHPPHLWVRRRMVRGLATMAQGGFDRWYLLAHSLGSVVAHNGLSETSHRLPHYLTVEDYRALENGSLGIARTAGAHEGLLESRPPSQPRRPAWLRHDHIVDRKRLFDGLDLFLTYGSPLDKFATMWPDLVRINVEDTAVGVDWVNVYDPRDPVAAHLDYFDLGRKGDENEEGDTAEEEDDDDPLPEAALAFKPTNVAYLASWIILLNHVRYLAFDARDNDRLVNKVARILVDKETKPVDALAKNDGIRWPTYKKADLLKWLRFLQWTGFYFLFVVFAHLLRLVIFNYFGSGWAISEWLREPTHTQIKELLAHATANWVPTCEQPEACQAMIDTIIPYGYPFLQTFVAITLFSFLLVFGIGLIRLLHKHIFVLLWPKLEL